MKIYKQIKESALFFSGLVVSILFMPYQDAISVHTVSLAVLLFVLFFIGLEMADYSILLLMGLCNRRNKKRNKIAIYLPHPIIKDENSSWINFQSTDLLNKLKVLGVKTAHFKHEKLFAAYPIVINPYGGVYPEKDYSSKASLNSIFNYVKNGGIYLNVADIPLYYAYDRILGRRVDTTPYAYDGTARRDYIRSVVTESLGIIVRNTPDQETSPIKRVFQLNDNVMDIQKELGYQFSDPNYSPAVSVPYGKGYFIFSTVSLYRNNIDTVKEIIEVAQGLQNG